MPGIKTPLVPALGMPLLPAPRGAAELESWQCHKTKLRICRAAASLDAEADPLR